MIKGSDIKGINTYHYTFILNTHKFVNEQRDIIQWFKYKLKKVLNFT